MHTRTRGWEAKAWTALDGAGARPASRPGEWGHLLAGLGREAAVAVISCATLAGVGRSQTGR